MDAPLPEGLAEAWVQFLSRDSERPTSADIYPDVFYHPMLFPLQRMGETAKMIQLARSINPRTVMEIGADKGGGLYHWIKCLPSVKRVIACEIRGTPYSEAFEKAFPNVQFLWLPCNSYDRETVYEVDQFLTNSRKFHGQQYLIQLPPQIDCLFIDGDKDGFLLDFEAYRWTMNPRGRIFLHDFRDPGPAAAVEHIKQFAVRGGYTAEDFIDLTDVELALRREADGLPVATCHEGWLRYWRGQSAGFTCIRLGVRS